MTKRRVTGAVILGALLLTGCDREKRTAAPAPQPAVAQPQPTAQPAAQPARAGADVTPKTQSPPEAEALSNAFASAAQALRPSVVRLDVEVTRAEGRPAGGRPQGMEDFFERFFGPGFQQGPAPAPQPQRGTGSGVIIDETGHVVTNSHVVDGASRVTIRLADGQRFTGKVIGHDPFTDVGVVRFEKKPANLTVARIGDSDVLRVGQWVIAVGSPLGLEQTVTAGIVSGLSRAAGRTGASDRVGRYIQTDALINPGNSGGPLVNLQGEVVGINRMINVGPGGSYGFAIPIKQVSTVVQTIIKEGRVRYPYLGVLIGNLEDIEPAARAQLGNLPDKGVVVTEVAPGGPAAQAGLRAGDVITKIAGRDVTRAQDVIDFVSSQSIGAKVTIDYQRGGERGTANIVLGELPGAGGESGDGAVTIGVALQTLTEPLARSLGLDPQLRGAVVADVRPGGPAERAGLQAGDVIREIDRKTIATAEEAVAALRAGGKKAKLLRVTSGAGSRFVTVTPE